MWPILFALLSHQAVRASEPVGENIDKCCHLLKSQFPGDTELAGSSSRSSYFSLKQAEMTPACRIYPKSASDVSAVVKIAGSEKCHFAVCSGGHMFWEGSSNTGSDGFVIDLGEMKKISTNKDNTVVSVEPGLIMVELYNFLDSLNISVAAGRVADVGVGGFLMGGGLSFFTSTTGFASNGVLNHEVVLADGSIVNANMTSEPELYYALKLGSTNYGIVTRFDLAAHRLPPICAGVHAYSIDRLRDISQLVIEFLDQPPQTPSMFGMVVASDPATKTTSVLHAYAHSCAPGNDQLFSWVKSRFSEIGEFADGGPTVWSGLGDFVAKVKDAVVPNLYRECWLTTTFRDADADLLAEIFNTVGAALEPFDVRYLASIQPFHSKSFLTGEHLGGNPSSSIFTSDQDKLVVFVLTIEWEDSSQDAAIEKVTRDLIAKIEALAKERGMLHPWLYLNYANSYQPVYERSLSEQALSRLTKAKDHYDPNQIFSKYWRGGFKISENRAVVDPRPVDEL